MCLSKEEGGRHTPFFNGYRPQFYVRTTDVTGAIRLPEGVEMVMRGDHHRYDGGVIPAGSDGRTGVKFAIREGVVPLVPVSAPGSRIKQKAGCPSWAPCA